MTNRVTSDSEIHSFDYLRQVQRTFGTYCAPSNLKLRLVSRAFNRAMTRVWFQHEFLLLRAFDHTGVFSSKKKPGEFERRVIKPNSVNRINEFILHGHSFSPCLRRLRLDLSTDGGGFRSDPKQWMQPDCPNSRPEDRESLFGFLKLLPPALERVKRLECLWVNMNETWTSDYGDGEEEGYAPQLDLVALNELRESLCSLFSPTYAHNFQFLTELRLALPCTYDFAALNKAMSDEAVWRLRHLYFKYVDATGPGGDMSYLHWAEEERGEDGDGRYALSNLQKEYLNYDYMRDICTLIGRCSNLESLGLYATHYLNLDDLDWKPSGAGLKNIYIYRAIVHFETLKKLLSAADGESSNIFALKLDYVQLLDHTWAKVFDHLTTAHAMQYFDVTDLNYAFRGKSAGLREFNNRPWENCATIWSTEEEDKNRLGNVVANVVRAGGSIGHLDDTWSFDSDTNYPDGPRFLVDWRS